MFVPRLADLLDPPAWYELALCAQVDGDLFYPEKGSNGADAKRICGRCEVKDECLAHALDHDEQQGVWGGLTPIERQRLQHRRAA